ncbi:hypothetical protein MWU52_17375 [Jannaschia sp. S6380]|uniref:hypothetical protein n=1 Tax=Jannaschia sp. S6380 TaxID=2926408 RepID=UPI001FF21028|nr:hypothetical protein [Jannaschia sp. S6380]MCK0169328.1 hypothetical protein [Jannaschia sp. S6380]
MKNDSISYFFASEHGAVTVNWVVLSASVLGLGLLVTGVVIGGSAGTTGQFVGAMTSDETRFRNANFGRSPAEVVADIDLQGSSDRWAERRLDRAMNDMSENQLRNQQRTWRNRAADPDYSNPGRAADQIAVLNVAMEARGVDPHP